MSFKYSFQAAIPLPDVLAPARLSEVCRELKKMPLRIAAT